MLGSAHFPDVTVVADLEAGIGTLTRLGPDAVDVVLVVVEPTPKSLDVGARAADVAREKGIRRLIVVANRVREDADRERVAAALGDTAMVFVPDDPVIVAAERRGVAPIDVDPAAPAVRSLVRLAERIADAEALD